MATIEKVAKKVAVRIWSWVSPGINHPMVCAPSDWLVERLSESLSADHISDEVWKIARRSLALQFPGLDRPLGSSYYPRVADVLDVAYHYGMSTQRTLRKVTAAAAVIATSPRELWTVSVPEDDSYAYGTYKVGDVLYNPPLGKRGTKHIDLCPEFLRKIAGAVREGSAPQLADITPSFFEEGWDARIAEMRRVDAEIRGKFASYIELFAELGVEAYSFREAIDMECAHGGRLCNHSTLNGDSWDDLCHDGEMETLEPAPIVREHSNQYHIGCYASAARVRVRAASYLVVKNTELRPAGRIQKLHVIATPKADLGELRKMLTGWESSGTTNPGRGGAWSFLR